MNIPYVPRSSERKTGRSEEGREQLAELQKVIRQTKPFSVEAAADYLLAVDDEAARMMQLAITAPSSESPASDPEYDVGRLVFLLPVIKPRFSEGEVWEFAQETAAREEAKCLFLLLGRKEDTVRTFSRRRKK
jgi:hypothetical protein